MARATGIVAAEAAAERESSGSSRVGTFALTSCNRPSGFLGSGSGITRYALSRGGRCIQRNSRNRTGPQNRAGSGGANGDCRADSHKSADRLKPYKGASVTVARMTTAGPKPAVWYIVSPTATNTGHPTASAGRTVSYVTTVVAKEVAVKNYVELATAGARKEMDGTGVERAMRHPRRWQRWGQQWSNLHTHREVIPYNNHPRQPRACHLWKQESRRREVAFKPPSPYYGVHFTVEGCSEGSESYHYFIVAGKPAQTARGSKAKATIKQLPPT